jgi:hypothetical protein
VGEANVGGGRSDAPRGRANPPVQGPDPRSTNPDLSGEPPPFGGSWGALYAGVLGTLATLILLFYAFMKVFE